MTRFVPSTFGVGVALHRLRATSGGPTLFVSHATGFHGRCYQPIAALLDGWDVWAPDYRGHGDTRADGDPVDWARYGDDAVAVAETLCAEANGPIVGFGHSMGGATLLMAALRRPELFTRLVVFEPIVFPPDGMRPADSGPNPMVEAARRRRASFPTFDAAIANYSVKPPMNVFTPEAMDAYVRYGFAPGEDGLVHLKCRPETEADTFRTGGLHDTWAHLPSITTTITVVAGAPAPMQPGSVAASIADRLPHGTYLQLDHLDHFGPMSHPEEMARLITDAAR